MYSGAVDSNSIHVTLGIQHIELVKGVIHRVIITDPENSNKMADAYQPRKHTAFIDRRNNIKSFF